MSSATHGDASALWCAVDTQMKTLTAAVGRSCGGAGQAVSHREEEEEGKAEEEGAGDNDKRRVRALTLEEGEEEEVRGKREEAGCVRKTRGIEGDSKKTGRKGTESHGRKGRKRQGKEKEMKGGERRLVGEGRKGKIRGWIKEWRRPEEGHCSESQEERKKKEGRGREAEQGRGREGEEGGGEGRAGRGISCLVRIRL